MESLHKATTLSIVSTHHHNDHAGENLLLLSHYPSAKIYGGDIRIAGMTEKLQQGSTIKIGDILVEAIETPGHTTGSLSYYLPDEGALFTGDTLFLGGCGRFFEGTADDMYKSLSKLKCLPKSTKLFVGHEYTLSNLIFANHVYPTNSKIADRLVLARTQDTTVPGTIGEELDTNPFLMVENLELQEKYGCIGEPIKLLGLLREMKNKF